MISFADQEFQMLISCIPRLAGQTPIEAAVLGRGPHSLLICLNNQEPEPVFIFRATKPLKFLKRKNRDREDAFSHQLALGQIVCQTTPSFYLQKKVTRK